MNFYSKKIFLVFLFVSVFFGSCIEVNATTVSANGKNYSIGGIGDYVGSVFQDSSGNSYVKVTSPYSLGEGMGGTQEVIYKLNSDGSYTKIEDGSITTSTGKQVSTQDTLNGSPVTPVSGDSGECGISGFTNIWNCVEQLLYLILYVASLIVGLVGILFNYVFNTTVVTMSAKVAELGVVEAGWTTIRDLCNIAFIFILLYLAISTILQLDEHGVKHTLSRLIIMAILVNFSFFFFGTIIDASNILAIEIYGAIKSQGGSTSTTSSGVELGDAFFSVFNLQSVYSSSETTTASLTTSTSDATATSNAKAFAKGNNTITVFVVGIIFMAVAGMVMLASLILFIKRFVILVFLLIFSPIAFAGMVLHKTEHEVQNRMWGTLLKESFYAPVYMFFIYLSLTIANTSAFKSAISSDGSSTAFGFLELGVIFNFAFIIVMLVFSIYAAEQVGVSGASGAINMFNYMKDKTAGAVWSTTGSSLAYNLLEKTTFGTGNPKNPNSFSLKQMRQGVLFGKKMPSILGSVTRGIGRATTSGLQMAGESRHHDIEEKKKEVKDTLHELRDDPKAVANYVGSMMEGKARLGGLVQPESQMIMKYVATEMKTDELANTVAYMRDAGKHEEADYMLSYAGRDVKTAVEDKIKNGSLNYHKDKMKELIGVQYDDHGREVYSGTHNQVALEKFASGLNAKQLASVLGNITQKQMAGINSNARSGIQTILNNVTDSNVFEQLQRDGNMTPEIREMASTAQYSSRGRQVAKDEIEKEMNDAAKLGVSWKIDTDKIKTVEKLFGNLKDKDLKIKFETEMAAIKSGLNSAGELEQTPANEAAIKSLFDKYSKEHAETDDSINKYSGGNGRRWYQKTDDVKEWERDLGGADITPPKA